MDSVRLVIGGRKVEVVVWECNPGQYEASTRLGADECAGPHAGCAVGRSVSQADMGRRFSATAASKEVAVNAVRAEVEGAVIAV